MPHVSDDLGRPLDIEPPPRRIISLVPSLTELLFALGVGSLVVGVTRYCTEPVSALRNLPKVGGTKNPDLALVQELRPELVLANAEENRREDVEKLQAMGLRVMVTYPRSVADVARVVRTVAQVTGAYEVGQSLAAAIERAAASVPAAVAIRVFCPIWKNPWMSFGTDTYGNDLLRIAGARNVCLGADARYPIVELERVAEQNPEVILLPDEPYRFAPKDLGDLAPLSSTEAVRSGRVYFVSGKALTWFGPRTPGAVRYLRSFLPLPESPAWG